MKVSVIIPTYNRCHYLPEAIESVLAQSTKDYELIVVDDASTDNTKDAIKPYLKHLIYIRKTSNEGFAEARNTGILHSRGEYIAYLDDDDVYFPFKLELQAAVLDHQPEVGMVFSEFSAFSNEGYYDEYHIKEYHESAYQRGNINYKKLYYDKDALRDLSYSQNLADIMPEYYARANVYTGNIHEACLYNTIVFTNSMMFRKELAKKTGLQDGRFGYFSDLEFALRLCSVADVAFIDIPTYKLRYHPDQVSTAQKHKGGLVNIRKQKDLLLVTKHHIKYDRAYYSSHRDDANKQIARLYNAIAVPKLSYQSGSRKTDRINSKHARKYLLLRRCYGHTNILMLIMTFMPHIIRRIYFKLSHTLLRFKYDYNYRQQYP